MTGKAASWRCCRCSGSKNPDAARSYRRGRPLRCGADLRRRGDHPGDLGVVGAGRDEPSRYRGLPPTSFPLAVLILIALFAIQPRGTSPLSAGHSARSWRFGFCTIAVLGLWGIAQHPSVLAAINPLYGLWYLFSGGLAGFLVLGGGVPVRYRRRSTLRRYGPFRRPADTLGVVGGGVSEPCS